MDPEEQRTFDAIQAEKAELGIIDEPTEPAQEPEVTKEPEPVVTEPETTEVTDPAKEPEPKTEPDPEPENHKQVPVRKFKEYKQELRAELQKDFDEKLEKLKTEYAAKPATEQKPADVQTTDDMEADIKALAEELEFDEAKTKRLIEVARKGVKLPEDIQKRLAEYDKDREFITGLKERETQRQEEDMLREQEQLFDGEWKAVLPSLKAKFPNASDEQLAKAQETMDELSHSEKYAETDLDYVLFKEADQFSKILFSPKQKTFEAGRPAAEPSADDDFPTFDPSMTPAQFEAFEKRRQAMMDAAPREKMRITTRDDQGRFVERME